jgi:hypothetical protein
VIFLNSAVLMGLAAVAIPVLIHLISRRKAPSMDWGAMRFLRASLAARQRRTLIEELILMVLRCLLVALVVMAVARPFIPSTSSIPWMLVLPAVLTGAVCIALAAVMRGRRLLRLGMFGLAAVLFGASAVASFAEYVTQGKQWSPIGAGQDIAIILDGSMSMTLAGEGRTNFERALDEARAVVRVCRRADTVTVVLAGPAPRQPVVGPTSDHDLVLAALGTLAPTHGPLGLLAALDVAATALGEGHNAAKKIVLITDGQDVGWETRSEARWQFLAGSLRQLPTQAQVICRTLFLPAEYDNAAVGDITLSRAVVGTDRPVTIDVKVLNCGTTRVEPAPVELSIGVAPLREQGGADSSREQAGADVLREQAGAIEPNAAETVHFTHRFDAPGPHVISARIVRDDDLPADNVGVRVVDVLAKLPVLVVDGSPSTQPLESAASFLQLAMAPGPSGPDYLIEPTVMPVTEVARLSDFSAYRVVVLANVPGLLPATVGVLALFVRDGGGLLIAPGPRAVPSFYNEWRAEDGEPFTPGRLAERRSVPDNPARLSLRTFSHPALSAIAEAARSDAGAAVADAYWRIEVSGDDPTVRVGARFEDGDPFLVERKVGRGFVMMLATAPSRRDTNLPALKCFVPLVHELAYYLAAPTMAEMNVKAGTTVSYEVPPGPGAPAGEVDVVTPSDARGKAQLFGAGKSWVVSYAGTGEPGLYRIVLPWQATASGPAAPENAVPFVVLGDPAESRLSPLTDADLERARKEVPIFRARTTDEMTAALIGDMPGQELWKQLAACTLLVLLAEIAVAGWITLQRRAHSAEEVRFGEEAPDVRTLQEKLRPTPIATDRKA